jgi:uncharacterized membrane protein (DUF2068 family)
MQQRPTGITLLAVLSAIGGVLGIFAGLIVVMGGGILGSATGSASVGILVILLGVIAIVLGVVDLAIAYGFWTLMPWSWPLGVAVQLVHVALTIAQVVAGGSTIFSAAISVAIAGIILYYLNQPSIRKAFGR